MTRAIGRKTRRIGAVAGLVAVLAAGCASTQELIADERWHRACDRHDDHPEEGQILARGLLERLDATVRVELLDDARVRAVLGEEGVRFAADRPLVAVRVDARRFGERRDYRTYFSGEIALVSVADGVGARPARGYWSPPAEEAHPESGTQWGQFARAMGALFSTMIATPVEAATLGTTSFGIRENIEGVADGAADAIETVDDVARDLTEEPAGERPSPSTFPEALNRFLDERACAVTGDRETCTFVRYLADRDRADGAGEELRILFAISTMDRRGGCYYSRVLRAALPAGATLAERLDRLFANGPLRLAELELVPEAGLGGDGG
jgi:hypothetical protein